MNTDRTRAEGLLSSASARDDEATRAVEFGRSLTSNLPSMQKPVEHSESDEKVGQTIAYMLQHLNKHLQVAKLAALINVSPSHFFALFKRQTGCAPIDFFIRLRMQHACQLLDRTSLNVKEVAGVLGYDDPFYFSRTFKSVNQVAPRHYRLMPRERREAVRNAALPSGFQASVPLPATVTSTFPISVMKPGRRVTSANGSTPGLAGEKVCSQRIVHGDRPFDYSRNANFCNIK